MLSLKKLDHHFGLMEDVAKRVGVDFGEALTEGRITPETLRGAALRCTGCTHPEECAEWSAEHADGAEHAPAYCRNGLLLDRLRTA
jgi:hypothetical protein